MLAFKWSWAVPERSGVVPGDSRARIIDFPLVLEGFLGGPQGRADPRRRFSDPLNQDFSRQTQNQDQDQACLETPLHACAQARWRICTATVLLIVIMLIIVIVIVVGVSIAMFKLIIIVMIVMIHTVIVQ